MGDRDGFNPHPAIFPADVLAFIKAIQPVFTNCRIPARGL